MYVNATTRGMKTNEYTTAHIRWVRQFVRIVLTSSFIAQQHAQLVIRPRIRGLITDFLHLGRWRSYRPATTWSRSIGHCSRHARLQSCLTMSESLPASGITATRGSRRGAVGRSRRQEGSGGEGKRKRQ